MDILKNLREKMAKGFFRLRYWCAAVMFYDCELLILPRHPDREQNRLLVDTVSAEVLKIYMLAGLEEAVSRTQGDGPEEWLH